jgi:phosphinothricin acetyltransferase
MASKLIVAAMQPGDWEQVREIYLEGIATGTATFETAAPSWEKWDSGHLAAPRLVARHGNGTQSVAGWAALSAVSGRCVYAGVVDESIYVAAAVRGQGVGRLLLTALCQATEAAGLWTMQAGIFPENIASLRLHEACGFRVVGRREKLGQLDGVWRDVILLERRSRVAGLS